MNLHSDTTRRRRAAAQQPIDVARQVVLVGFVSCVVLCALFPPPLPLDGTFYSSLIRHGDEDAVPSLPTRGSGDIVPPQGNAAAHKGIAGDAPQRESAPLQKVDASNDAESQGAQAATTDGAVGEHLTSVVGNTSRVETSSGGDAAASPASAPDEAHHHAAEVDVVSSTQGVAVVDESTANCDDEASSKSDASDTSTGSSSSTSSRRSRKKKKRSRPRSSSTAAAGTSPSSTISSSADSQQKQPGGGPTEDGGSRRDEAPSGDSVVAGTVAPQPSTASSAVDNDAQPSSAGRSRDEATHSTPPSTPATPVTSPDPQQQPSSSTQRGHDPVGTAAAEVSENVAASSATQGRTPPPGSSSTIPAPAAAVVSPSSSPPQSVSEKLVSWFRAAPPREAKDGDEQQQGHREDGVSAEAAEPSSSSAAASSKAAPDSKTKELPSSSSSSDSPASSSASSSTAPPRGEPVVADEQELHTAGAVAKDAGTPGVLPHDPDQGGAQTSKAPALSSHLAASTVEVEDQALSASSSAPSSPQVAGTAAATTEAAGGIPSDPQQPRDEPLSSSGSSAASSGSSGGWLNLDKLSSTIFKSASPPPTATPTPSDVPTDSATPRTNGDVTSIVPTSNPSSQPFSPSPITDGRAPPATAADDAATRRESSPDEAPSAAIVGDVVGDESNQPDVVRGDDDSLTSLQHGTPAAGGVDGTPAETSRGPATTTTTTSRGPQSQSPSSTTETRRTTGDSRTTGRRPVSSSSGEPEATSKVSTTAEDALDDWPFLPGELVELYEEFEDGVEDLIDTMSELTTAWLVALGVLSMLLGCCVLYALRQMTVLREAVDQLTIDLSTSRQDLERGVKDASKKATEAQAVMAQGPQSGPNSHAQAAEAAELLIRVRTVEKELNGQNQRLTEYIHRAAQERAAPRQAEPQDMPFSAMVTKKGGAQSPDVDDVDERSPGGATARSLLPESPIGSPSPTVVFDEDSTLAHAARMGMVSPPRASQRAARSANRGLSFSLPPKLWVYERMHGDPRDCVMKKRLHAIMLGTSNDVNVAGEVCFLYASIETSRMHGMQQLLAEAARNRTGAPGVTCIPASSILAMDVRPAPRELVDSMGPVAGDGHNLLVSIYRTTSGAAFNQSSGAGGARKQGAAWTSDGGANGTGERSGTLGGSDTSLSRRAFLSKSSGASGGPSVSDKPFVVFMPSSLALDEWVQFVSLLLGDRVKVMEGALSEASYLDL